MKHPGHTYGGFISAISERGMTEVLPQSTGQCTITAPSTHLASHRSISSSIGLPAHLSASTSRQHLRLCIHLHLCCACLCHRQLEPPPVTPASTVVAWTASLEGTLESAPHRRRMPLRTTSPIRHVVRRMWLLQRPTASTTPLWRTFPRASKSSQICFL
jgi:hypothetical protein